MTKNEAELLTYVKSKYNNPDGLHHYETLEYIHKGEVLIPEGIQVNESYQIILPDGSTISSAASRTPVSNYEWESFLNEKKRFIKLPTPAVVTFMEQEFIDLAGYDPCPELDEAGNKKTKLSIVSKFLNSSGYVGVGSTPALSSASNTTFDYGPTAGVATSSTSTPTTTTTSTTTTTTTTTTSTSSSSSSSSSGSSGSSGSQDLHIMLMMIHLVHLVLAVVDMVVDMVIYLPFSKSSTCFLISRDFFFSLSVCL